MVMSDTQHDATRSGVPPMPRRVDDGPVAWDDTSLAADAGMVPLGPECRDELRHAVEILAANPLPPTMLTPDDIDLPACRAMMRRIKEQLDDGIGFAVIDRLPVEEIGPDAAVALHWLLGSMVATGVAQKWDDTMKYDVRDTGRKPTPGNGVRSSVSNCRQEYHTDNSYNLPPDYVALLCLQKAAKGGISGLVSFQSAHNRLLEERPLLLERLYGRFCFDRQAEHAADDPETVSRWPVFAYEGERLRTRYAVSLIRGGHQIAGEPLDAVGDEAIAALDAIIEAPEMTRQFAFEPGQIQIVDNRRIGHRRTGFEDAPGQRRHLVRMWFRNAGRRFYAG